MSDENQAKGSGINDLLAQKEKLEQLIKEQYTRYITVMFTDLKGSTAIADLQGDLAARMIIKKHNDILNPIIRDNKGVLVKTMGDGTMSYYEREIDAVRAAVRIQNEINAYNDTIEGQAAIRIRVGISSGKGIVEENDIFGDVVNVSSRFESSCEPSEIYIAENTFEGLKENKEEFFIRHVKNITFKGKSTPSKVFKVFYKPEEIEKEKTSPTNPDAQPAAQAPESQGIKPLGIKIAKTQRSAAIPSRAAVTSAKMTNGTPQVDDSMKELKGGIVKKGDIIRLTNQKYRVLGEITVVRGAVLILENVELFFAENAGIVSMGGLKAVNSVFTAIDEEKGWRNVTLSSQGDKISELDNCKFHFGRGRTLEALKATSDIAIASPQNNIYYGGGLFIAGGTIKTLSIKQTTFFKCTADEGGGIFMYRSQGLIAGCTFDSCMAKTGSGGGILVVSSDAAIEKCSFNKCSSGKNGGGACFNGSKNRLADSAFRSCLSKLPGGGLACIASSPQVNGCRFERCSSAKSGGGIYQDPKSNPVLSGHSFENCKPNNMA